MTREEAIQKRDIIVTQIINELGVTIETNTKPLIRCKDCKKANTEDCSHSYWDDDWGVWRIGYKGDEWFCADGEKEGE